MQGRFSEVYSCASKASASIDGIGIGPYAIKIVSKNKKGKAHKKDEEGGDVEMVSGWIQHMQAVLCLVSDHVLDGIPALRPLSLLGLDISHPFSPSLTFHSSCPHP